MLPCPPRALRRTPRRQNPLPPPCEYPPGCSRARARRRRDGTLPADEARFDACKGEVRDQASHYRQPTKPRFYGRRGKKNGGREGFPRLAAVCWAGGQPETPSRNSSLDAMRSTMTASYHLTRCGTIENRSFVTFSRISGASGAHAPPMLVSVRFFSRFCAWAQPPSRSFACWLTAGFTPASGSAGLWVFPALAYGTSSGGSKRWACAYSRYAAAVTGWPRLSTCSSWMDSRQD